MTSVAVILKSWEGAGLLLDQQRPVSRSFQDRAANPVSGVVSDVQAQCQHRQALVAVTKESWQYWIIREVSSSTAFLPSQPLSKPEALAFLKSPWAAQHLAINSCSSLSSLTDRVWHFQLVSPSDIKYWK